MTAIIDKGADNILRSGGNVESNLLCWYEVSSEESLEQMVERFRRNLVQAFGYESTQVNDFDKICKACMQ